MNIVKTFKPEFAPLVLSGAKTTTIRPWPKGHRPQIGDTLSARQWSGRPYHSKQIHLLEASIVSVETFCICEEGWFYLGQDAPNMFTLLNSTRTEELATADGFIPDEHSPARDKMLAFFKSQYHLPFKGILLKWNFNQQLKNKKS